MAAVLQCGGRETDIIRPGMVISSLSPVTKDGFDNISLSLFALNEFLFYITQISCIYHSAAAICLLFVTLCFNFPIAPVNLQCFNLSILDPHKQLFVPAFTKQYQYCAFLNGIWQFIALKALHLKT